MSAAKPSVQTDRTACPVLDECGACPQLHLLRDDEVSTKAGKVIAAFHARGMDIQATPDVVQGARSHYRNRLRIGIIDGRATLVNKAKQHGCPALRPELWDAIETLCHVTAADPTLLPDADHAEVRVGDEEGQVGLSVGSRRQVDLPGSDRYKRLADALGQHWLIAHRQQPRQPTLRYSLGPGASSDELRIDVPIDAFVQVNSEVNKLVVSHVRELITETAHETFIDLFAGAGNFSVPLVDAGLSGVAVEQSGSAIDALADQQDYAVRLDTMTGDVHHLLASLAPADVVVCNPPRKGVKTGHARIAGLAKMVICISCDPHTLARDSALFVASGLELKSLRCFDMFPGTDHIETVAAFMK